MLLRFLGNLFLIVLVGYLLLIFTSNSNAGAFAASKHCLNQQYFIDPIMFSH